MTLSKKIRTKSEEPLDQIQYTAMIYKNESDELIIHIPKVIGFKEQDIIQVKMKRALS